MISDATKAIGRREFLGAAASLASAALASNARDTHGSPISARVIDDHQHTHYSDNIYWPPAPGRSDADLVRHQRRMGAAKTILLPAGSDFMLGLPCGGNDSVVEVAHRYPGQFAYFCNEDPRLPGARKTLEKYLKLGAIGIGEQKFPLDCDAPGMHMVAEVAQEYNVPVLLHFEDNDGSDQYANMHLERFHTILQKFPKVIFIAHAQTWWANIDAEYQPGVMYPKGRVTRGGISERLLADYPNMYADISAGSGLNALLRDEDYAREFLKRFQDRLTFGSDCSDTAGHGPACKGWQIIQAIRRLAPEPAVTEKILHGNTERIHKGKVMSDK